MSDTPFIIAITAFQVFIILSLGFINVTPQSNNQNVTTVDTNVETFSPNFVTNIITNINEMGAFSVLLFSPLLVGITYVIAKLIRGGG